ncbi:MAG: coniferyl-alcohol dehydrogenase [Acidimicrobiia bacterium]
MTIDHKNPDPVLPTPDDMWGYNDKRVVVTGAASGMGLAAAKILVALGAEVTGVDVQPIGYDGVVGKVTMDLSDRASIESAATELGGGIDALFNCAGIPGTADPRKIIAVNFSGTRHFTELIAPNMNAGGAICNIGSTAAVSWPLHAEKMLELMAIDDYEAGTDWLEKHLPELGYAYDVSKEAVNVYTAYRASVGFNAMGLRMNCINPGSTYTAASKEFTKAVKSKDFGAEMLENWPKLMGRMARPDEQAWPMVFLNSKFASYTTGTSLFVDAGLTGGVLTQQHHPMVAAGMFWRPPR